MRIVEETDERLVVEDSSFWIAGACGGVALITAGLWAAGRAPRSMLIGAAFWGMFAVAFARKSRFEFLKLQRAVVWRKFTSGRRTSGRLSYDEIRGVALESSLSDQGRPTHRLELTLASGSLPMADAYSGGSVERHERLRARLLAVLGRNSSYNPGA